MYINQKCYHRN